MGMSVGGDEGDDAPMNEINTTPLVDVMLVLLIIFLIAVPAAIQTAPIQLAKESSIPTTTKPENIVISVDAEGNFYWNASLIEGGKSELRQRVQERVIAAVNEGVAIPEVHVRADRSAAWQYVGGVIANVQVSGIPTVGFISEPSEVRGSR